MLNLILSAGLLILFLGPIFLFVGILYLMNWKRDKTVTTPLSEDLLRPSGYSVSNQLFDKQLNLLAIVAVAPMVSTLPILLTLAQGYFGGKEVTVWNWGFSIALTITILIFASYKTIQSIKEVRKYKLAVACEMAVGQQLESTIRPKDSSIHVYHDIPFDKFNVDHLVVTTNGVFVIETKGRSKPLGEDGSKQWSVKLENNALHFPGWTETKPLKQTQLNVKSVTQWLSDATGFEVPVKGVLVLPGWYVERKQKSVDPFVMSGKEVADHLPKLRAGSLTPEQVRAIAYQIEQKVRTVDQASVQFAEA